MGREDEKKITKKTRAKKGKTNTKGKGKSKTKGGKKGKKASKADVKRLNAIAKAFAYGQHFDLFDVENAFTNMSGATLAEVKALFKTLKSGEKLRATDEGRDAQPWAAGPESITAKKDAVMLFNNLDRKKTGKVDFKFFLDQCAKIPVKTGAREKTPKQLAEEKRLEDYAELDWTSREAMYTMLPAYVRQQIALERKNKIPNKVDIEYFSLKVPFSGTDYLLEGAELKIGTRQRLTLVGEPGSGKSTLFRAMAHQEIKDFPIHLQVWHMKELEVSPDAENLLDTVVNSHSYLRALRLMKAELQRRIAGTDGHPTPSAADAEALDENLRWVLNKLREQGDQYAEEKAAKSLRVLGFDDVAQQKSINSLSGGLRMRVALCAAFFVEADILLLDEPTNHLDFPSLLWLENKLRTYPKSLVMVCHDREILENVCSGVILITDEKELKYYDMRFEAYEKTRQKAEDKYAKDTEKFLARNRNIDFSSPIAVEAARRRKWLQNYCRKMVLRAGQFTFPPPSPLEVDNEQLGTTPEQKDVSVIKVTDVRFSYDPETLPFIFDQKISIDITMDSRMGVMGPNGAGKSTFLKLLTGRLHPVEGTITKNKHATVAYFSQHHSAEMDLNLTPLEFMIDKFPEEKVGQLRSHLAKVGCSGDLTQVRMTDHSQGMRSCVLFAGLTYTCPNLLIMDEPTNFLDIETVDALISATRKYKGALLLVSHSRLFLKKCAKKYLSIVPGSFDVYDTLAECEQATYTFIADMENGDKVRMDNSQLATSAGTNAKGGKKAEVKKSDDGIMMI